MSDLLPEGGEGAGIEPYDGTQQTRYGGSKRRKRGKRNSGKNSRRRSKKYMKKMYRGGEGEGESTSTSAPEPPVESVSGDQGGGRRRRKGKMQKGKTRKGKVSKWITHVKNFSRANKMDFRDALKDPKCKASYHKMK